MRTFLLDAFHALSATQRAIPQWTLPGRCLPFPVHKGPPIPTMGQYCIRIQTLPVANSHNAAQGIRLHWSFSPVLLPHVGFDRGLKCDGPENRGAGPITTRSCPFLFLRVRSRCRRGQCSKILKGGGEGLIVCSPPPGARCCFPHW
jgi:hypothetical protein